MSIHTLRGKTPWTWIRRREAPTPSQLSEKEPEVTGAIFKLSSSEKTYRKGKLHFSVTVSDKRAAYEACHEVEKLMQVSLTVLLRLVAEKTARNTISSFCFVSERISFIFHINYQILSNIYFFNIIYDFYLLLKDLRRGSS